MTTTWSAEDLLSIAEPDDMATEAQFIFERLRDAGDGYAMGGGEDLNRLQRDIDAEIVLPTDEEDGVAIYRALDGRAILVGFWQGEIWAVELTPGPGANRAFPQDGLFSDQDYENVQSLNEESASIGGPLEDAFPFDDEASEHSEPVEAHIGPPVATSKRLEEQGLDPTLPVDEEEDEATRQGHDDE